MLQPVLETGALAALELQPPAVPGQRKSPRPPLAVCGRRPKILVLIEYPGRAEKASVLGEVLVELVQRVVERSVGVSPIDTYAEGACGAALLEDGVVVVHDGARPELC